MSYFLHGATLALAWFLATNVVLSAVVAALAPGRDIAAHARPSAVLPLLLRLLPATASAAFVAGVFVPSYWMFEPRDAAEGVDVTVALFAAGGAWLLAAAALRGAIAWCRAVRRVRAWTQTAAPLGLRDVGVPAFRIDAPQPVMALAGVLRPRLLVTRALIDALTPEELAATVAHEVGHHHARDNLKRLAMVGAPDALRWTPAARRLERQWAAAAEHRADAVAARRSDRTARLTLASALVKVARLMPASTPIAEPISTLIGGGEIARRVQRLIDDDRVEPGYTPASDRARWGARSTAAAAVLLALGFGYAPLLAVVHAATEILVHRLP